MRVASVGDRIASGSHALLARYGRAANYEGPSGLLSIVTESVGEGPVNIVLSGVSAPAASVVRVEDGAVWIGGRRFATSGVPVYSSDVRNLGIEPRVLPSGLAVLEEALGREAPPRSLAFLLDRARLGEFRTPFERDFARRAAAGARALFSGDEIGGARRLRGCGFGLTPSGDDFLCGVMIGLNALDVWSGGRLGPSIRRIRRAAGDGGVMSRTYLDLAAEGRAQAAVRDLLDAIARGSADHPIPAVRRLLSHGATSGADLAVGLAMALRRPLGRAARAFRRGAPGATALWEVRWSS